jgi:hypothetical protein
MEFIIRILALAIFLAGAAASTSKNTHPTTSHQAAVASLPGPTCTPDDCP